MSQVYWSTPRFTLPSSLPSSPFISFQPQVQDSRFVFFANDTFLRGKFYPPGKTTYHKVSEKRTSPSTSKPFRFSDLAITDDDESCNVDQDNWMKLVSVSLSWILALKGMIVCGWFLRRIFKEVDPLELEMKGQATHPCFVLSILKPLSTGKTRDQMDSWPYSR